MNQFSKNKMPLLLGAACFVLIALALYLACCTITGVVALLNAKMDDYIIIFVLNQLCTASLTIVPLLVFVRLVHAIFVSKEFFSRKQSQRMMTIAICFAVRVALDLLAPRIEIPGMFDGAIGPMSIGPSLNLTMLAVSIMFFALAGVFEYGRKLQDDSDSIL